MMDYPALVCLDCGNKYARRPMPDNHVCSVHVDICGVCGKEKEVTEPRDFGHLRSDWVNERKNK